MGCAKMGIALIEENQMLTSWTNKKHTAERQFYAGMLGMCLANVLNSPAVNNFGGELRQRRAQLIDSGYIKQ